MSELLKALRPVRWRLRLRRFVKGAGTGFAAGALAALVLLAVTSFVPLKNRWLIATACTAGCTLLAGAGCALWPVKPREAALAADACGLQERSVTALELAGKQESEMILFQRRDACDSLNALDTKQIRPDFPRRQVILGAVLLVLCAGTLLLPGGGDRAVAARQALEQKTAAMARKADEAAAADEAGLTEKEKAELRKLTEDLKRDLNASRDELDAMVALDKAEQQLEKLRSEQMRDRTAGDAMEAMDALSQAMQGAGMDPGQAQSLSEAMESGNAAAMNASLSELDAEQLKKLAEGLSGDAKSLAEQLAQAAEAGEITDAQLQARAELLEQTLNDFGVDARVLKVTQGASVTRYEVQPATGVKVASITRLADDIALNLRAKSLRIEAPIPGKAAVGIEVENDKPAPVLIRDLIESEEFMEASSIVEFVVGKDISGNNIVADLSDMPHLLIAGATGSGKSVCINSIITSFLYKARPSELKLIMIDPKVVELGNYNGIPHMLTPVVTDPRKAARALAIAVEEMDKRYELFAEHNVKDLNSYNELMRVDQRYADCKPQIVIIIDELADLMMASPSEVENSICRLAQKARAAGMHLIVATQRPSVDVVTGLIKANIPSRIAFSVASQFDSRTILDMAGAEKLLGKGDMLFSPVGSTKPYRVQGPYISEKEIDKVIKFVKKAGGNPDYDEELKNAIENADKRSSKEPQDELTEDAIAFIFKSKQASVSMLQRRFRIGYNRAARIIDEIEEKGIIGPSDGSRPRQLLITEEEYYGGYEEEPEAEPEPVREPEPEPEPVYVPETKNEPEYEMASEDDGIRTASGLSKTQAMDSFNSLPESVRRMIMDADSESDY